LTVENFEIDLTSCSFRAVLEEASRQHRKDRHLQAPIQLPQIKHEISPMSNIKFHMIKAAPTPVAPFSHATEADGFVFVTGQMPTFQKMIRPSYPNVSKRKRVVLWITLFWF
jgi:hypothetical protein